jgi:ribulose 1,5-bisphosphate synthetase/thiazole synthase
MTFAIGGIMQKRKVIIAEGGLSRLDAAYALSEAEGFDINMIKKDNYLDGRVPSCTINEPSR